MLKNNPKYHEIYYCRKSTEDKEKQTMSLSAQKREIWEMARKKNLEVAGIYTEEKSAKKLGRPEFAKMLNDLKTGKADGILCWKLDRLARNFIDGGEIIHLLQNGSIKEIVTPHKIYYSNEPVYLMSMEFGVSNQFSRDLSINVKRGNKEKLINGGWPSMAPFGYLNVGEKGNKTIIIDKERENYIKQIFELYATGRYSLSQISKELYDKGLRSKLSKNQVGGKKIYVSKIHKLLKNPFYYGLMVQQGESYRGNHKAIISKKLFDQCQEIAKGVSKPRNKKHKFLFRGLCSCDSCGCAIVAEKQRGHSYYRCTNGKGGCEQKSNYLRGFRLNQQIVENIFSYINFDQKLIDVMYQSALEKKSVVAKWRKEKKNNIKINIEKLSDRRNKLIDLLLDEKISQEIFNTKDLELKNEITNLELELKNTTKSDNRDSTIEQTKKHFETFVGFKKNYSTLNNDGKRELLFNLLLNIKLKDRKIVSLQWKEPFDIIAKPPEKGDFASLCSWWNKVMKSIG